MARCISFVRRHVQHATCSLERFLVLARERVSFHVSANAISLILNRYGYFAQLIDVLGSVMPTEKKLAVFHRGADVCLSTTDVAAIKCGQFLLVNHCCVHTIIKALRDQNIPTLDCEFTLGGTGPCRVSGNKGGT